MVTYEELDMLLASSLQTVKNIESMAECIRTINETNRTINETNLNMVKRIVELEKQVKGLKLREASYGTI